MEKKEKIFTKGNLITMVISIAVSVFIIVLIAILGNTSGLVNNNSFKIESFNMDTEKSTYTYSDDSYSYTGSGVLTCWDKSNDYYVLLEKTNTVDGSTDYTTCIVMDGKGDFGTYDSSYSGTTQKPEYEFKVLGFIPFNK